MFSGDRGSPMKYFRYLDRPYAPPNDWYRASPPMEVDWREIACSHEFVLITQPFDAQRIGVSGSIAAQNSSGTLLEIDRRQCRIGQGSAPG
jgi:hypothetical protein